MSIDRESCHREVSTYDVCGRSQVTVYSRRIRSSPCVAGERPAHIAKGSAGTSETAAVPPR